MAEAAEIPEVVVPSSMDGVPGGENAAAYLEVDAKATVKDDDGKPTEYRIGKCFYKFGTNLAEATELFGEEVVFTNFRAQSKIRLQAIMRTTMLENRDLSELATKWKPGVQMERAPVDPEAAAEAHFAALDKAGQEAFIKKLLAKQSG